ncbi:bacillithiol biosynthesis cysteine-adding enzyme BshC [Deinococcus cellulosilyticus]|uniref:Putative cysteine ligase BshC n=1 Tax=Deinococcus cellulosilyticus (strain DSM 18568 / NBRC 106333 / KACC 11606 / 5516J-15) TaxID=1223518 RepID=A0A511MZT1_DEIC1|nr:bacillithiol biosynthesis cysteine-adding enzyme BshC [Deinococcus cellulosilyticus]GEM46130.1 hypothetical protein DC3_17650 [Deinococcus cellulosilyticus NBRC 106333 = KACC 11606]
MTLKNIASHHHSSELRHFYRLKAGDLSGAVASPPSSVDRSRLVQGLRAYHERLGTLTPTLEAQLTKLQHPNSRVVVAGQQAGLLLGPAFTVHKAVDAILLARQLDTEEQPVLPIFWVASQDHDALEVASTMLLDFREHLVNLSLPLPQGIPVYRIPLHQEWVDHVSRAISDMDAPFKDRALKLVQDSAKGNYADWFAGMAQRLLGEEGLITFDPMFPELAALFVPALERELERPLASPHRIEDAAGELIALGFEPQLRRQAGATNLFLEGNDGHRRLLRYDGSNFHAERMYTLKELQEILRLDPSRITPAAGLRPIVQDTVLPTIINVLGPGELAYATQLGKVYDLHGVAQPLLWKRLSVTYIEPPVRRILSRYGITAQEFQRSPSEITERLLLQESGVQQAFREKLGELELLFEQLAETSVKLDVNLEGSVHRSRQRVVGHVQRLERKLARHLMQVENAREGQFGRLYTHLLPGGVPQERAISYLTYLAKYGDHPLKQLLSLPAGAQTPLDL